MNEGQQAIDLVFSSQFMLFMIADSDETLTVHYLLRAVSGTYRRAKLLHRRMIKERVTDPVLAEHKTPRPTTLDFANGYHRPAQIHRFNKSVDVAFVALARVHIETKKRLCLPSIEVYRAVDGFWMVQIKRPGMSENRRAIWDGEKLKWAITLGVEWNIWLPVAEHLLETFYPLPVRV